MSRRLYSWHRRYAVNVLGLDELEFIVRRSLPRDGDDRADLRVLLARLGIDGQVLGLRADESGYRRRIARTLLSRGDMYRAAERWGSGLILCPILDWSLADVWAYHAARSLPHHRAYDERGRQARSPHAPWRS